MHLTLHAVVDLSQTVSPLRGHLMFSIEIEKKPGQHVGQPWNIHRRSCPARGMRTDDARRHHQRLGQLRR